MLQRQFSPSVTPVQFWENVLLHGMLRGQISMYLPPEHPIIDIWNNGIQNGRRIGEKVYYLHQEQK